MKLVKLLPILMLALISTTTVVYAAYTIWSNRTDVITVGNVLTLTSEKTGVDTITLTATLTNNAVPVKDASIHFYRCDSTLVTLEDLGLGTLTDGSGVSTLVYTILVNGEYYFKASYDVA